jgi:tetratricopeptide (TPR) repeat protein
MAQADTVLKRDPDNTQAVKMKGDAFFGMGKYKEGIDFLKKAIAQSGDNPEYYYHIGLNSIRLEDLPTAQSAFEATVKLDPRKDTARYYLARIYLSQARVKDALKVLDDGKMRDSGLGHLFMAFYYAGIPGMTASADREFETALKELPESGLARREYGQYMLHSGRPRRALELFEEAEKLDPSFKVDRVMQGWKRQANSILGK